MNYVELRIPARQQRPGKKNFSLVRLIRELAERLPEDGDQNPDADRHKGYCGDDLDFGGTADETHAVYHGIRARAVPFSHATSSEEKLASNASINSSIVSFVELSMTPVRMTLP